LWTILIGSKLSSAHVYLRQTEEQPHGEWDKLPVSVLNDAAQLVKANSIEGEYEQQRTGQRMSIADSQAIRRTM
jgi:hypothetical protein